VGFQLVSENVFNRD